jgi:hypothetical protein
MQANLSFSDTFQTIVYCAKSGLGVARQTWKQADTWKLYLNKSVTVTPMIQSQTQYLLTAVLAAFALLLYNAPNAYILCSPSNNIYTVDPAAPRVACISVRGDRVHDIGSLRDFYPCLRPSLPADSSRRTPGSYSTILPPPPTI